MKMNDRKKTIAAYAVSIGIALAVGAVSALVNAGKMTNPELAGINGSVGEWGWDGAFGNWFCVDPKENLTCVYLTTNQPGDHYRFVPRLMASMYASL